MVMKPPPTTKGGNRTYRGYRGIHILRNDEGLDKNRHCPSFEDKMPDTLVSQSSSQMQRLRRSTTKTNKKSATPNKATKKNNTDEDSNIEDGSDESTNEDSDQDMKGDIKKLSKKNTKTKDLKAATNKSAISTNTRLRPKLTLATPLASTKPINFTTSKNRHFKEKYRTRVGGYRCHSQGRLDMDVRPPGQRS